MPSERESDRRGGRTTIGAVLPGGTVQVEIDVIVALPS